MEVFATTMAKSGPVPFLGGEVGGFFRFVVSFQVVDPPSFGFFGGNLEPFFKGKHEWFFFTWEQVQQQISVDLRIWVDFGHSFGR